MQDKGEGKQVESEKNKASGHLHKPLMRQLSCENEEASHRRNNKYLKSKSCTLKKKKIKQAAHIIISLLFQFTLV